MRRAAGLIAVILLVAAPAATAATAVAWAGGAHLVIVARPSSIAAYTTAGRQVWSGAGVPEPEAIEIDQTGERAAVLDPLSNRVMLLGLRNGAQNVVAVPETPIVARFSGDSLLVLCRDGRELVRISRDGAVAERIATSADPAFMAVSGGRVFVYSRTAGRIVEYRADPLRSVRSSDIDRFASDFEIGGRYGYLVLPRSGRLVSFLLDDFQRRSSIAIGAVPADLAIDGDSSAISAGFIAVADPSSRRVWRTDREQSLSAAVSRGFIRGLLGLGLYNPASPDFPTGVDRLFLSRWGRLAYDSSSGSLFEIAKKPRLIARGLGPLQFAATPQGIAIWDDEASRLTVRRGTPVAGSGG